MKKFWFSAIIVLLCLPGLAQDLTLYKKQLFISNGDTLPYRLLLPENYNPKKKYPLVFFLHGAGERGNNNEAQLVNGGALFIQPDNRKNFPAIVVFPQCAQNSFWSNVTFSMDTAGRRVFEFIEGRKPTVAMMLAQELLKKIISSYPVEKKQVYVGGLSMGGMGTFEIVERNPGLFAGAIAICGGANPAVADRLKTTSWWIFHGVKDDVVPPVLSQRIYDTLIAAKATAKLTMYPEANHNSWDSAFAEKDLLPWLFAQQLK